MGHQQTRQMTLVEVYGMSRRLNLIVSGVRLVLKLYVEPSVTLATVISSSKAPTSVTLQTQAWFLQSNLRTASHHE